MVVRNSYWAPFKGWVGILSQLRDSSHANAMRPWWSAEGVINFYPGRQNRYVNLGGQHTNRCLDAYFNLHTDAIIEMVRAIPVGSLVIVDGELSRRWKPESYLEAESQLTIKNILLDPSEGKRSPRAALMLTSDLDVFRQAASLRYNDHCASCDMEKLPLLNSNQTVCPTCHC